MNKLPYSPELVINVPAGLSRQECGLYVENAIAELMPDSVKRLPEKSCNGDLDETGFYGIPIVSDIKCTTFVNSNKLAFTLTASHYEKLAWLNMTKGVSAMSPGKIWGIIIRRFESMNYENTQFRFCESIWWEPSIPEKDSRTKGQIMYTLRDLSKNVIQEIDIPELYKLTCKTQF